jgi:thymidylate synthase (FAD)
MKREIPGGGSVELLGVFGTDLDVANCARVSMDKHHEEFTEGDVRLIHYLASHGHWTPFAQPQARFRFVMPLFVARQWFKSTVGLTRNEVSRRYVDAPPIFVWPVIWREKAENVKQGSGEPVSEDRRQYAFGEVRRLEAHVRGVYQSLLDIGICPEQARSVLPQSMATSFIETGSLAAYARIIRLRDAGDAQQETAAYARAVRALLLPHFPVSLAALCGGCAT